MALVLADRVLETTSVAGTGDASLDGAVTGYQPFSVIGGGNTTYYTIVAIDDNGAPTGDWEVGIGTYVTSGNKVSRDTVLSSSNGGALVYFASGNKQIFLDLPSEELVTTASTGLSISGNTITNTAPDQVVSLTGAGTTTITGTYPSFTITSTGGSGGGDVTGPASAVADNFAAFNMTTGKLIKDSGYNASSFAPATSGTSILYGNGTGGFSNVTIGTGVAFAGGTLSATGSGGDVVGPASSTDNAIARFDTTTGKLLQNSVITVSDTGAIAGATTITDLDYLDFDTTYATTLGAGQLGWNGNDTLGLGMIGGNVVQHIGEDTFFYVKASATITKGQLCMFTGTVGSSGVLTAAPSNTIPYAEAIIGVAAEDIANNAFGLIQNLGTLRGVDTSAFLDGDILYYNSAVTGGFTKTFPTSGPIVVAAAVAKSGSGGSGVLTVRVSFQTRVTASTGISVTQANDVVTVTNTAPDQTVALTAGTGISTSGTYPNFTITNSAPDQTVAITGAGGAVVTGTYPNFTITTPSGIITSVSGTAPIASSGGATPAISISQATTSTDGYLSSTDWNTFNNKQPSGSYLTAVTASAPLSGSGTVGSPLVISQATTSTNGYLSSTDWNTFNNKGSGTVTSVTGTAPVVSSGGATPAISMAAATTSVNGYLTSTDWNTFNGKYSTGGALGTPSSGTLTNCTGYTYANLSGTVPTWNQNTTGTAANVTGTVAVANGGTGLTSPGTSGYVLTSNGTSWVSSALPAGSQWTTSGSDIYYTTGSVGIGNSSMSSFNSGYNNLVVGSGTGNEGLAIYAGSTSSAYLGFKGAASTSAQGLFEYDCSDNTLYTYTNGTFRTSINGSGVITYFNTPSSSVSGANFRVAGNQCYMNWSHGSQTSKAEYIYWINGNGTVGSIFANGSSTTYATSSDYRLKEDVKPMVDALATVALLKPVTYKWKCDGSAGQGFIAHELQEVVPDCVGGEKDAVNEDGSIKPQGIDTSFLVATLTAAIQELDAKVKVLESKLAAK